MANIKSAIKRIDVTKKQTLRNKSRKSEIKTYIKKFENNLEAKEFDKAKETLKVIDRKMKRAASKNVLHKNKVSRTVSRLTKQLNSVQA